MVPFRSIAGAAMAPSPHSPTSDPDKGERRREETIKEGMLDKTIL